MTIDRRALLGMLAVSAAPPLPPSPPKPIVPAPAKATEDEAPTTKIADSQTPTTETVQLWPGEAPGSPPALPNPKLQKTSAAGHRDYRLRGVAAPAMFVYRPEKPNGIALIVMPGGGYAYLSMQNEGTEVARWFTPRGYTVFVLSYRLPGEGWTNRADAPIQDGMRAVRLIRANARQYGIDPTKIGVLGFSAGGHLAASLTTNYGDPLYEAVGRADDLSAKPAFAGLLYAVTSLRKPGTHSVSRANLLGPDPSPALIDRRSPVLHISQATPPCFVTHALDDGTVDPVCSIDWLVACREQGVPVEAHMIERGGHGFGLHLPADNPGSRWPELFHLWLRKHV